MLRAKVAFDRRGLRLVTLGVGVLLGWVSAGASRAEAFEYNYNLRPIAQLRPITLSMRHARVHRDGHVAVWVGVDNGIAWLQAGIAVGHGDDYYSATPYLYLERTNGDLRVIRSVRWRERVRVSVACRRDVCTARAGGAVLREYVPQRKAVVGGESYEPTGRNFYSATADAWRFDR